jgi:hypothetical protein
VDVVDIAAFITETQNPGNVKRVAQVTVAFPSDVLMDARGFEVDAEFEPPDDQSTMSFNTTLTSGRDITSTMPTLNSPSRSAPMPATSCAMKRPGTASWI